MSSTHANWGDPETCWQAQSQRDYDVAVPPTTVHHTPAPGGGEHETERGR